MKIVAVCEDHENDQCSYPYLVDLDKLPKDHKYRLAVESGLEDGNIGFGEEVDRKLCYDYSTKDKYMKSALVKLPFTGTVVGLVKIYTD